MNSTSRHFNPRDEAKTAQCRTVHEALRQGPKSTMELRALNVMSPAARVLQLRKAGVAVETLRIGRCAVYRLREVQ